MRPQANNIAVFIKDFNPCVLGRQVLGKFVSTQRADTFIFKLFLRNDAQESYNTRQTCLFSSREAIYCTFLKNI